MRGAKFLLRCATFHDRCHARPRPRPLPMPRQARVFACSLRGRRERHRRCSDMRAISLICAGSRTSPSRTRPRSGSTWRATVSSARCSSCGATRSTTCVRSLRGERLELRTWIDSASAAKCKRATEIVRVGTPELVVARAMTTWGFVELASGRPTRIPDSVRVAFSQPTMRELSALRNLERAWRCLRTAAARQRLIHTW